MIGPDAGNEPDPAPEPPAPPDEFSEQTAALFGLASSDDDQAWIERARSSETSPPLGFLGPYELLEEIGRGGQGEVYKSRQPGTGRLIALKRLARHGLRLGPDATANFSREVEAVTRLSHPGVVTVYTAEVIQGHAVLAMELVEGERIDCWADACLSRNPGGAAVRDVLRMFNQVCAAVAHAHQRGVIHRDIKPSNVLVDRAGAARVLDFGISQLITADRSSDRTATSFAGTPTYAAPEQFLEPRPAADTRCDVYSLGVLLLRLAAGHDRAVEATTGRLVAAALGDAEPALIRRISERRGLPTEVEWIIRRATASDPTQRYQSVEALSADIDAVLDGRVVQAHPPSWVYVAAKLLRRHILLATLSVGLAAVLATGATIVVLALLREQDAHTKARQALEAKSQAVTEAQNSAKSAEEAGVAQQEVFEFLTTMLQSSNTELASGRADVTVREILERAAADLDANPGKHPPRVESAVRFVIGETYHHLGLTESAERHLRRAVELRREVFGENSSEYAAAVHLLARVYRILGDLARAEALQREVVRLREAEGPGSRPYVAQAYLSLGIVLRNLERFNEAREALQIARDLYAEVLGERDLNVGFVYGAFGGVYLNERRLDEAEASARLALEIVREAHGGANHPDVLSSMGNHAATLLALGREQEGWALHEEALRLSLESLGSSHGATITQYNRMLEGAAAKFQWQRVETVAREALAGATNPGVSVRTLEERLVESLVAQHRESEAAPICESFIAKPGPRAAKRTLLRHLALCRAADGLFEDGEALALEAWTLLDAAPLAAPVERRAAAKSVLQFYQVWAASDPGRDSKVREWTEHSERLAQKAPGNNPNK